MKEFLPISQEDINARGWEQIDFFVYQRRCLC